MQYTYQHRDESEFLHQEKLSFHLLLPSSSGQISQLQDVCEVYLLSIPDLCFWATWLESIITKNNTRY